MALIRIKNIRHKAIIGVNDWERTTKQDVIINVTFEYDDSAAVDADSIDEAVDYRAMTKAIVDHMDKNSFFLLETLSASILDLIMRDKRVKNATVEVDKPGSVRFADSISVQQSSGRS
ncbi:MAG: dihydroneopterin aldolase [Candidatus Auribacterota bacterium]|jgi:D-erythro-7,8-dihydroneopterin triphosphate epimerase|nr:dihydroneopterin aldolase [Candidatus Auribacterota bacterium]